MALFFQHYGIPFGSTTNGTFNLYHDNRHLLSFGPTRSGKGATVIVPALLTVNHSVLCIDPKGQNAAICARQRRALGQDVYLLNPFNELGLGTACFNPLARLRIDQPNVVADVRSLADALIIANPKDPHWTDSARDLITTLMLYLVATKPGKATLVEMRELLSLPPDNFMPIIRTMVGMVEYPFICQPAGRFGRDTKEIASVISTAQAQTFFLDDPNIAKVLSKSDFSVGMLKSKPTTIFVILPERYLEAYSRFFRLVLTDAIDQLTSRPGGHKTLLLIDEAAVLQGLNAVSRAFSFIAGYNVQLWLFYQNLALLKADYPDRWETFKANAGVQQFFTPGDLTTADYIQQRAGTERYEEISLSKGEISKEKFKLGFTGISENFKVAQRPKFPPELSMSMHGSVQCVFFNGVHEPVPFTRYNYWKNSRLAGLYDKDPFHDNSGEAEMALGFRPYVPGSTTLPKLNLATGAFGRPMDGEPRPSTAPDLNLPTGAFGRPLKSSRPYR